MELRVEDRGRLKSEHTGGGVNVKLKEKVKLGKNLVSLQLLTAITLAVTAKQAKDIYVHT